MNKSVFDTLTSNHYKTLKALYDHHAIAKNGRMVISVTQREIAEFLQVSTPTVIVIFKSLIKDKLIERDKGARGRYYMTEAGAWAVNCFERAWQERSNG